MLNKFKSITNKEENKRLVANFFSLVTLQGVNYILPLITFPYLVRVLGVENFGLLSFATATVAYFNVITDYGFNLTATREISVHREDKDKLVEIFSSVMSIKIILMFLSFILLCILVFSFEKFSKDYLIYLLTFGTVIGQTIFPIWFFQGMERMKYITYLNILAKLVFTVAIFIFIQNQNDYYIVPLLTSIGFIVAGISSLILIKKEFSIHFKFQSIETLHCYFMDGFHIFISRLAANFYTSSNIFILGFLTNNMLVGYYSIAEKVFSAFSAIGNIITTVLFPYLSKIYKNNYKEYFVKFSVIFRFFVLIMFILALILFLLSPLIIELLSGKSITESVIVLKILSVSLVLFPLGSLYTQSFVTQGNSKYVTKATFYTALLNLILVFPMIYIYNIYGLAITVVLVQVFQVIINYKYFIKIRKKK